MGFLPEALFNYLALLGWSSKDDREFFTKEELINLFTLESVNKAPAVFDIDKLKWMNHHYISKADDERICRLALPYMIEKKWIKEDSNCSLKLLNTVNAVKGNMETIKDIIKVAAPFFEEIDLVKTEEEQRILKQGESKIVFSYLIGKLQNIEFTEGELDKFINELKTALKLPGKKIYHPMRIALIGSKSGPELTKIMLILGKERVIDRFSKALNESFPGTNL
jgi:nondiscriminating glutamyl-tRNA synthetase